MGTDDRAFVAGAFEHPTRHAPDKSQLQLHAEVARGALVDAGLSKDAVDGYFTAGVPEREKTFTAMVVADYLGLRPAFVDTTDLGGCSYVSHVGHATDAIAAGDCDVALVTFAACPRSRAEATGTGVRDAVTIPDTFERTYGTTNLSLYAMATRRHIHEYGTTREQLAAVRVAASRHAQHNPNARFPDPVTVKEVTGSRLIADPLRLYDCCGITDGGGAVVVVSEDAADRLDRECIPVCGHGEAIRHRDAGRDDVTTTAAVDSGERAFAEAGIEPADIDYASLYDAFTIMVVTALEDLGFCAKGEGGSFVEDGALIAPDGRLPVNTDGGSLCSNHPNRGGMFKLIEAVRQLRGEANDPVQLEDVTYALVHGYGAWFSARHAASTLVLGGEGV